LASPVWGGNRDKAGWKLIGFEDSGIFEHRSDTTMRRSITDEPRSLLTFAGSGFRSGRNGRGGGIMAKELPTAGFSVVALEQGPSPREGFRHDEFGAVYRSALVNDYKRQPNTVRKSERETAKAMPGVGYGRQVGGGSVHFTGNYWRFHESDFHGRGLLGAFRVRR
jgi:hypothetical protein